MKESVVAILPESGFLSECIAIVVVTEKERRNPALKWIPLRESHNNANFQSSLSQSGLKVDTSPSSHHIQTHQSCKSRNRTLSHQNNLYKKIVKGR